MSTPVAQEMAASCLVMRVRRLNREVTRMYDAAARRYDMTSGRSNVLVALAVNPGARAKDLVEPLSMEKSTLSRNIARLVADGLVESSPDGRDRRLRVTTEGLAKLDAMQHDWRAVQSEARALLGDLEAPLLAHSPS